MTRTQPKLILASASPRRLQLLKGLGLICQVIPPHIPEILEAGESPENFVIRLSCEKALAVAKSYPAKPFPLYFLGADTIVLLEGKILGKPAHPEEAALFLSLLSGKTHEVLTGFAIVAWPDKIRVKEQARSKVTMKKLTPNEIETYVQTGEPLDKAGAYAAQGIGKKFIERIEGSESNVIGLPIEMLTPWLKKLDLL